MSRSKRRPTKSARVVYGLGPVEELLRRKAAAIERLLVRGNPRGRLADVAETAVGVGVEVIEGDAAALDAAAGPGATHQGIVAFTGPYAYADLIELLDYADGRPIVVLDGVTDPHNLGAICRSTYLLGGAGVIIGRDRAAPVNAVATKASAGATEYLRIAQVTNIARALIELKGGGIWRAQIAAGPEAKPLRDIDKDVPLALVMGSEGRGLRQRVASETDFAFAIPMAAAGVGSFNVSVAAALALYELAR